VSRFVLDNTVTMAWCFNDEATPFTETLLSRLSSLADSAIVPALWLWHLEFFIDRVLVALIDAAKRRQCGCRASRPSSPYSCGFPRSFSGAKGR
jgi:hypothetical protein